MEDTIYRLNKIKNRDVVVSYIRNHPAPEQDFLVMQIAAQYAFDIDELVQLCKSIQKE